MFKCLVANALVDIRAFSCCFVSLFTMLLLLGLALFTSLVFFVLCITT